MIYRGHSLYRVLTAISVVMVLLFGWQLFNRWDWGALLFMAIAAWSAIRSYRLMASRVELTDDRLRLLTPGSAAREIEFRQLSDVYDEGRGLRSILLLYHPRLETGLFDLDSELTLVLPAVDGHDELLAALKGKLPS